MLRASGIRKSFGGTNVLSEIEFSLQPKAITCLLGGNGSGKTTLFNLITGFLRPDAGTIHYGDAELTHEAPFRISRLGVARTFQDLRLITKVSVRDNILLAIPEHPSERLSSALLPQFLHRDRDAADRRKADTLLSDYFLAEVADQPASEISYGQQKLLTFACCAALDASLLLLDEPVAGISPEYRERIAERLASLTVYGKTS
ncbi:MAG: ATP-binding cassette domain-containing protein [Verrucomicrobiales bacterium]|nr:ATP-binding cassette domain-containing protein [Verrucomicrobiales bacterium]